MIIIGVHIIQGEERNQLMEIIEIVNIIQEK